MTAAEIAGLLDLPEEEVQEMLDSGVLLDDGSWVIDDDLPEGPPVVDR